MQDKPIKRLQLIDESSQVCQDSIDSILSVVNNVSNIDLHFFAGNVRPLLFDLR